MRAEHYAHRHGVLVRAVLVALVSLLATAGCATTTDGHGRVAAQCAPVFLGVPGSGQG
ncbi:MAG: hypothetical protein QOJ78_56, partial [Pseudonocardiales bacterium]|nr:hypothetical protein [Pseudonocardiales bacterium]